MRALALATLIVMGCHAPRHTESAAPPASTHVIDDAQWARARPLYQVPVGHSPARGPANALVTIVELSAFACASCATVDAQLAALRAKYGDDLRIVWKNRPMPMQTAAEPAAEAALEVRVEKGDAAFWAIHDRLVALPRSAALDADALVTLARESGANEDRVRNAIRARTHRGDIEADMDLAEDFEVEAAPCLFVNGRRIEGEQRSKLEMLVEEEMKAARELLAKGTPREAVYEARTAGGMHRWEPRSVDVGAPPPRDPVLGDADAKVTVHVWSDYQCALCTGVEKAIAGVREEHHDVRFVWHDLALARHADARRLAEAAREAQRQRGDGAFWKMHDAITMAPATPEATELDGLARAMKLDVTAFRGARERHAHEAEIAADERAAREVGITESPTFVVVAGAQANGTLVGNVDYASKLGRAVERALDEVGGDGD
jgi:protein-disulfide isomerase